MQGARGLGHGCRVRLAVLVCEDRDQAAIARIEASGDVREVLKDAAMRMVRFFMSDVGMQVYRIVVGESQRFPEVGREFYNSGPAMVREFLVRFLSRAVEEGKLRIDDVELAADQFPELCKAGLHLPMVLGIRDSYTEDEIERVVDGAVEMFLCQYGAEGA